MGQQLSIGAVALQTGISVRALRLYEEAGLVRPGRTDAGRRVFDVEDLQRLQQIMALKKAGCTLAQIAAALRQGQLDPADLIDLQISALEQQHEKISLAIGSLRAARGQLAKGAVLTIEALCKLIKSGEEAMTEQAWKPVWNKYYTPEEQERWKTAKMQFTEEDGQAFTRLWSELIVRVEIVISQGAAPDTDAAMALAIEWYELQKPMVDAVGIDLWNKSSKMYHEMNEWQTDTVKPPFSLEVYEFILKAADAARIRGVIPPKMIVE